MTRWILVLMLYAQWVLAAEPPAPVETPPPETASQAAGPDDSASVLATARAYLDQKKYQHALNAYSSLLTGDRKQSEAASGRALALVGLGDVPKAVVWATKATEWAPDDLNAWNVLGQVYLTDHYLDAPRAEATFRQMLVLDPKNRTARLQLARALSYQKKVDNAIGLLEQLVAEQPRDWPVQIKLAESYYTVRKLTQADEVLENVLAAQPDNAAALRLREAISDRRAYLTWVPAGAAVLLILLYLVFRRLRRGKLVRD